jgi:hypothetical protein
MELSRKGIQSDASLDLFARLLKENSSRYEKEALTLLAQGRFDKIIDGVLVVHFLRDGGCGYQISNETPSQLEEVFFQSLDEDTEFNLKLIVDQLAQSEVDAKFLIKN